MSNKTIHYIHLPLTGLLLWIILLSTGCNTTKYLKDNQYLLKQNTVKLKSKKVITNKAELKDNLTHILEQKPNSNFLGVPVKLLLYNIRYKKYQEDTTNFQLKSNTVERPVIFDSSMMHRSAQDLKNYMYNQGYFYAHVDDTVKLENKKAYATYTINTGDNYLINKVNYDCDDSAVAKILHDAADETGLQKNTEFSMTLLEDERSRVVLLLRDHGYYRFSQENVTFQLDTVNKSYFKDVESPFESAITFVSTQKSKKKPTLDVNVIVRPADDSMVYTKYTIDKVRMFPDFNGLSDLRDSTMEQHMLDGVTFKYHDKYVNENVLLKHTYLLPGKLYKQSDYDKTIVKLNELGIFQFIRITFREDPKDKSKLDCTIMMNKTKKHLFSVDPQVTSGSTYSLGSSLALNYRDRNIAKGANLLTVTLSGGVETVYNDNLGNNFFNDFFLLTRYYGVNASIDFPKFLAPVAAKNFDNSNLPHTIIGVGSNLIDRIDYFTLVNTSANFTYNWHQSRTVTWELSPVFVNIIRVPQETDSFKEVLDSNQYLFDTYKPNFIEGESLSFTYNDNDKKRGRNYSYLKLGIEEAGALLSGINALGAGLNDLYDIKYAQYVKFDFDGRHYFTLPHSTVLAFRFDGGIGLPYGQSDALPYIKQYFVGGPYSLRGWRIRSLGPGSYYVPGQNINSIDRTGDIKLEASGEYRFFIANLFSGFVKFNGAIFADAGNIWLAKSDDAFRGGEFEFNTLGQDIAVNSGIGARFDVSFLTLRLDMAMPMKEPYVPTNYGWVLNQIDFSSPSWRSNNIIFNLSIGYPF